MRVSFFILKTVGRLNTKWVAGKGQCFVIFLIRYLFSRYANAFSWFSGTSLALRHSTNFFFSFFLLMVANSVFRNVAVLHDYRESVVFAFQYGFKLSEIETWAEALVFDKRRRKRTFWIVQRKSEEFSGKFFMQRLARQYQFTAFAKPMETK